MLKKIFYLLSALVLLVPLIVSKYSMHPFIFYKAVTLQIFSLILSVVYLYYIFYADKKFNRTKLQTKISPLFIAVVLFYLTIITSSIFGYDWSRSLWSRAERMTGVFVLLQYFLLYIIWRDIFDWQEWKVLWQYLVGIVGGLVVLVGFVQVINPYFLSNLGSGRVGSTLGNAIYLAGFCTFVFFSALYFFITTKSKYRFFWLGEVVVSFFVLIATQTRGDIIGFAMAMYLFFILYWFLLHRTLSKNYKRIFLSLFAIIILLPTLLLVFRNSSIVRTVPVLDRFFSQPLSEATGGTRLIMWKTAIVSWQQKPIFGWGWDNFYYAANQNYLPEFLQFGHAEEWTDNAHNVILNTLATVGIVGLSAYLAIFLAIFYLSFRLLKFYKVHSDKDNIILISILLSFVVSHFIRNIFAFEDLSSYLYFFFVLATFDIIYITYKNKGKIFENKVKGKEEVIKYHKIIKILSSFFKNFIFGLVVLVSFYVSYRFVYIPAKASYWQSQAIYTALTDFDKSLDIHRKAIAIDYNIYRADIAFNYADFLLAWMHGHPDFATGKYRDLAQKMYDTSASALYSYLSVYHDDARIYYVLGNAFLDGYDFWMNKGYVEKAVETYANGLKYSPKRQSLFFGLIRAKVSLGNYEEASQLANQTLSDDSSVGESHWMLAFVDISMSNYEEAVEQIKEAEDLGFIFPDDKDLTLAFRTLLSHGDPDKLGDVVRNRLIQTQVNPNKYLLQAYIDYLKNINDQENLSLFEKLL